MHSVRNEKIWTTLSVDEKLDALHEDMLKLFAIAEESSHKNHMCVDAINILHGRLQDTISDIRKVREIAKHHEPVG